MGKPEGKIEDYLLEKSKKIGGMCVKFTSPGTNGVPDRVIILPEHKTVFVELKAPGEKLRALQRITITKMQSHGAIVFVASTKSAVDVLCQFLSENDYDFICNRDNIPDIIRPDTYF